MMLPIPVYIAHPTRDTSGDAIKWSPGAKARLLGQSGKVYPVTIMTGEQVGHAWAPGVVCMEVTFDDEGGVANCVPAAQLRLR